MKVLATSKKPSDTKSKRLKYVSLERSWPVLNPVLLGFMELKQDNYFPFIPKEQIPFYIEKAIQFGQDAAQRYANDFSLKEFINILLKQGVRVNFVNTHPSDQWIRAQYLEKKSTIEIYRPSLVQIKSFFQEIDESVDEKDIIVLHLYHEWFHHLEEKKFGRTDRSLPKTRIKKWGPFVYKRGIRRTREIAAHAFTQAAMNINWSPLLLDYLLLFTRQGWTKTQIREHFQQIKNQYEQLTEPEFAEDDEQANP
ncbi:hypothetical protein ACFO25_12875 [Paenactinomyces guangxiensis]|uniref:Uncharacterized protein n=1 Tax=Paenactinomyces guangxiensis TaxID=1490290 RepID=A0A7W2A977_9BACL|nr:hypothetical protein [Paenactinomyces guangxiensis]MBA4494628.1 hypothetical protein [Paenactinomyces guangxiensis]MBH8591609.1 hypothetical protein [Paenactinomyces guangxiensis]